MPSVTSPESPTDYELLPRSEPIEQQRALMGREEQLLKPESRQGDLLAKYTALVSWPATSFKDHPLNVKALF
jgi:hypothetical protein